MVTTEHEGRGKAVFVPKEGEEYSLYVVKPSSNYRVIYFDSILTGILNEISFPKSKREGVILKSNEDVFSGKEVTVTLVTANSGKYRVNLSKKMHLLHSVEQVILCVTASFDSPGTGC